MPEQLKMQEATARFAEAIHQRGAVEIEMGWRGIGPEDRDPLPGEPQTWYTRVVMNDGREIVKEATNTNPDIALMASLSEAARSVGLRVRVAFTDQLGLVGEV